MAGADMAGAAITGAGIAGAGVPRAGWLEDGMDGVLRPTGTAELRGPADPPENDGADGRFAGMR